jgi:hypothetical protein
VGRMTKEMDHFTDRIYGISFKDPIEDVPNKRGSGVNLSQYNHGGPHWRAKKSRTSSFGGGIPTLCQVLCRRGLSSILPIFCSASFPDSQNTLFSNSYSYSHF